MGKLDGKAVVEYDVSDRIYRRQGKMWLEVDVYAYSLSKTKKRKKLLTTKSSTIELRSPCSVAEITRRRNRAVSDLRMHIYYELKPLFPAKLPKGVKLFNLLAPKNEANNDQSDPTIEPGS